MTVSVTETKPGMIINQGGHLLKIMTVELQKLGRNNNQVKIIFRSLQSGESTTETYKLDTIFQEIQPERHAAQYLERDGDDFIFMSMETHEQFYLHTKIVGDKQYYIQLDDRVEIIKYKDEVIDLEIPSSVILTIAETEPVIKGITTPTKLAITNTDLNVTVPMFIEIGNKIKIDSRTGKYIECLK